MPVTSALRRPEIGRCRDLLASSLAPGSGRDRGRHLTSPKQEERQPKVLKREREEDIKAAVPGSFHEIYEIKNYGLS